VSIVGIFDKPTVKHVDPDSPEQRQKLADLKAIRNSGYRGPVDQDGKPVSSDIPKGSKR